MMKPLPFCETPLNPSGFDFSQPLADSIKDFVGGDCICIKVKYLGPPVSDRRFPQHSRIFIEYNSETSESIFDTGAKDYFRYYVCHNPEEFLKKMEWVDIYMFGTYTYRIRIIKKSDETSGIRFYGSEKYIERFGDVV